MKIYIRVICFVLILMLSLSGCSALEDSLSSSFSGGFFDAVGNIVGKVIDTEDVTVVEVEQTDVVVENYTTEKPEATQSTYKDNPKENVSPPEADIIRRSDIMCYSKLNSVQKRIYRTLLTVSDKMIKGWINLGDCGEHYENNISVAYRALTSDHPEIFWMPNTYLLSSRGFGKNSDVIIAFQHNDGTNSCDYTVSKSRRDAMKKEMQAVIDEAKAKTADMIYGFDIELALHDFICEKSVYDETDTDPLIYTSYGALVLGKAVCEGYSRAMQLLCDEVGLPCVIIYGVADSIGHMWNLVNPGDGWYHLDVTWDDTAELIHNYFNLNDEDIAADHTVYEAYSEKSLESVSEYHEYNLINLSCNKLYSNYFYMNGHVLKGDYSLAAACISLASKEGKNYVQLRIESDKMLAEFASDYQTAASKTQRSLNKIVGNTAVINGVSQNGRIVTFYW